MRLDPIIDSKMDKFKEKMALPDQQRGGIFEKFVNYSILIGHQPDAFNGDSRLFDSVNVGGYDDIGIDGIAIKVNDILIRDIYEVQSLVEKLPRLEIEFIFIQSKYKEEFTKAEFISFVSGVRDFLSLEQKMPHGNNINELLQIKDFLISEDVISKWTDNPSVRLYYVTMAKEHNSKTQIALSDQFKKDIANLNIYREAKIDFINRYGLKSIIDSNERNFEQVINFRCSMPLTEVETVHDSCVLLCYANELKKLLISPDGLIRKSLFDDNVRDFQGNNAVNSAIAETVKNEPEKFALLNNGITIVCDKYTQSNMSINIKNPQIVNGCQTSHVLFYNNDELLSRTPVIIKLISTDNMEAINQIVRGTNSQNIVYKEAFETTRKFHKDLEDFINALSSQDDRFYYERRSKQYEYNPSINYFQKINFRIMIQSIIAMFFNNPHVAYRHELKLIEMYKDRVFSDQHSKYPYFTAAFAYYKLESLFRENVIEKNKFRNFNMHILMIFRELTMGDVPDINNTAEIEKYCKELISILKNAEEMKKKFEESAKIFQIARENWVKQGMSYDGVKDVKGFTELILQSIKGDKKYTLEDSRYTKYNGRISKIGLDRYGKLYGFIKDNSGEQIFFHSKRSLGVDFSDKAGCYVIFEKEFDSIKNNNVAINVNLCTSL